MRHIIRLAILLLTTMLVVGLGAPAQAQPADPKLPVPGPLPDLPLPVPLPGGAVPGISDCKEAPTPESPGQGIAGFFAQPPEHLPPEGDPFAENSRTTIYEQYGYAGLRWRTYDLGCGPDAMRNPDAVIGTAISNWIMQPPIALTALTGSITEVAFQPTFLGTFDPVIERVSSALHTNLFASWIPAVLALLGILIIFKARRSALSTTAAAVGWAVIVVILATALFRWPIAAGNAADQTVTGTLGVVVGRLDGDSSGTNPGTAVSSHVHESILYRAWLAGTFGSPDSETAKKYGPELFKSQALTWREAAEVDRNPEHGEEIIAAKNAQWTEIADKIRTEDPEAYEHLTGERSETRVGYALVSGLGIFLALPFLLLSALLMLGCFLIVRLAVMIFPAFAILGIFAASRGLVTGLGRTVAAAVVNAIVFGIGAGITIAVLGILFHPGGGAPGWLSLVLMPLFSFIMWVALKPFRRLTSMVSPSDDHFQGMANPMSGTARGGGRWAKKAVMTGLASAAGGGAGAAAGTAVASASSDESAPPARAEAMTSPPAHSGSPAALNAAPGHDRRTPPRPSGPSAGPTPGRHESRPLHVRPPEVVGQRPTASGAVPDERGLPAGFVPRPTSEGVPAPPTEPEWYDGEEIYPIYRPAPGGADDAA